MWKFGKDRHSLRWKIGGCVIIFALCLGILMKSQNKEVEQPLLGREIAMMEQSIETRSLRNVTSNPSCINKVEPESNAIEIPESLAVVPAEGVLNIETMSGEDNQKIGPACQSDKPVIVKGEYE